MPYGNPVPPGGTGSVVGAEDAQHARMGETGRGGDGAEGRAGIAGIDDQLVAVLSGVSRGRRCGSEVSEE